MNPDLDEKLGRALREDGVPERDALFRINVIQRRERQQFRIRSRTVVAAAIATAGVPAVVLLLADNPIIVALGAVVCIAAISASVIAFRSTLRVFRWLRAS